MFSLRSTLQKCVRTASILGSSPICLQTPRSSNAIHLSRLAYSNGNSEEAECASQQMTHAEMNHFTKTDAIKSPPALAHNPEANENPSSSKNKSSPDVVNDPKASENSSSFENKPSPGIVSDPEASENPSSAEKKSSPDVDNDPAATSIPPAIKDGTVNTAQKPKNLDFRRYHIFVRGFSKNITKNQLAKFYSRFGTVIRSLLVKNEQGTGPSHATIVFSSKKAMESALKSSPHRINGEELTAQIGNNKIELTLCVRDLSPETTDETLRTFYSKFGNLTQCEVKKDPETGELRRIGNVSFASHEELDRALDAQPHVIDGSEVFLKYTTGELDLKVKEVPEGITEESLCTFFSQYGRVRHCELITGRKKGIIHAYLTLSSVNEVNRAMADRPHIIDRKILRTDFGVKRGLFSVFVDYLPENTSRVSLFKAFSQFGKIVYLEVHNDRRRPFGIVDYGTQQEANRALNDGPHEVDGVVVDVRDAKRIIG